MTIYTEEIPVANSQATKFQEVQLIANHRSNIHIGGLVSGFVSVLATCDKATEEHTQRVTVGAAKLARAMGFSDAELMHVKRGALLHDVGKIFIPYRILCKKGPLVEQEKEIIRRHPSYAYNLLRPFRYLRPALDIPYCHHEKWDGTGYPRGLKGQQIPLAARIFSIIDVWDALCSNRPYRAAWPQEDAKAYIYEQSGKYFDSDITSIFLQSFEHSRTIFTPNWVDVEKFVSIQL